MVMVFTFSNFLYYYPDFSFLVDSTVDYMLFLHEDKHGRMNLGFQIVSGHLFVIRDNVGVVRAKI